LLHLPICRHKKISTYNMSLASGIYISGANFSSFSLYINFLIFQISIVYFLRSEVSHRTRYAEFGSSVISSKANSTSYFLHHFFSLNRDTKTTLIILCFEIPKVWMLIYTWRILLPLSKLNYVEKR